jgi:hypothetical protein
MDVVVLRGEEVRRSRKQVQTRCNVICRRNADEPVIVQRYDLRWLRKRRKKYVVLFATVIGKQQHIAPVFQESISGAHAAAVARPSQFCNHKALRIFFGRVRVGVARSEIDGLDRTPGRRKLDALSRALAFHVVGSGKKRLWIENETIDLVIQVLVKPG